MYYPDQRFIAPLTLIRRRAYLPEEATGSVQINEGRHVDLHDVVAEGLVPAPYYLIDAARFFRRRPSAVESLLLVELEEPVDEGQVIAGRSRGRGKRLFAPAKGSITEIDDAGRLLFRATPQVLALEAGVRGRIAEVEAGRGVVIEAVGARVQGVWGNDRRTISTLRAGPDDGLATIRSDALETRYRGVAMITRQPLDAMSFLVMDEQGFAAVIAPSMDASLITEAMESRSAVLLTEGFGSIRMNATTYGLLTDFEGQQATIDAHLPTRWETRSPEVIINRRAEEGGQRPSRPNPMLTLRTGMTVRVTREPFAGFTGRVVDLPKSPVLLDNGLQVPCANVELIVGETITVPLANLEVLGR
jgi:hypothetical protein